MEVAGQWRREWAGTAEYGKVTEGGVTRQVARAMEVLHASAPGARVRVLRAAYHSTAGPGEPASSYLLHSSRRVISSGYNFIEPDTSQSKPLEISSTPLESSPELEIGIENYKVTEPDDFDISEPSKWRGSRNINSIRMPSEESSSTDNASIIDLDYNNKITVRKNIEKFTSPAHQKRVSPISSLLDTPITLSTLKYKSLLNGSDSWNSRRKSYSFEETPELDESNLKETEALIMESSTDSGICKSSEIVNSENCNLEGTKYVEKKIKMDDIHEETFKDWLSKNRKKPYINQIVPSNKEHIIGIELNNESNITLQSAGKVSITLQTAKKSKDYCNVKNDRVSDEYDKRTKKVEFCKTELHFAAESGTVNIIATDEKPPPSTDFRKKRSMFVPISNNYNKSITLFGDKSDVYEIKKKSDSGLINDGSIIDENTAATKSILKNKIPKPKPYLLGENMVFGESIDLNSATPKDDSHNDYIKPTGASLVNRQLQLERKLSNESRSSIRNETDWSSFKKSTTRTAKIGPVDYMGASQEMEQIEKDVKDTIKTKVKILQLSPILTRAKTRQLRESDLTYFGVTKTGETQREKRKHSLDSLYDDNLREEPLHSVQLVKLMSNSVCNSEIDSDETPDYENIPVKYNFTPKPAPRSRSKYNSYLDGNKEQKDLNPILEKDDETVIIEPRRVKVRRNTATPTNRSLSEPPKANRQKSTESHRSNNKTNEVKYSSLSKGNADNIEKNQKGKISNVKVPERKSESPLYANLETKDTKKIPVHENNHGGSKQRSIQRHRTEKKNSITKDDASHTKHNTINRSSYNNGHNIIKREIDLVKEKVKEHNPEKKNANKNRTKVLVTPEKSPSKCSEISCKKFKQSEKSSFREKKVTNSLRQKHGSLEPQETLNDLHDGQESKEVKASTTQSAVKTLTMQKHRHKPTTDTTSIQKSSKEQQEIHSNDIVPDTRILQPKGNKMEITDKTENKSRRSKYVINYDDKNGTVSSIHKIRPDHESTKKKRTVNYDNKDNIKNHIINKNNNSSNKNNLLQLPDQQRILYGNSKTKSKIRARQSCQIL